MNSRNSNSVFNTLGWLGAALLIVTYALYSFGTIPAEGMIFNLLNALGAAGVALYAFDKRAWPIVLVLLGWGALSLYSLYVYL